MKPVLPTLIEGIPSYAPEQARSNEDYNGENFEQLFRMEDKNFWFRSRNRLLTRLVSRYLVGSTSKMLEIGCGTGYVLKGLSRIAGLELVGAERHLEGLIWAKQRMPGIEFIQLDATRLPFESAFDAVGAFDVLEHIEEDEKVLAGIYHTLRKSGLFFASVPQHRFRWSQTDELANHKRRYTRQELLEKINRAGFEVLFCSSFVTCLFPALLVSRCFKSQPAPKNKAASEACELNLPKWLNGCLECALRLDEALIGRGISLPFGGSLLLAARKRTVD